MVMIFITTGLCYYYYHAKIIIDTRYFYLCREFKMTVSGMISAMNAEIIRRMNRDLLGG